MVIDAGGGTVDLSTYKFTSVDPITVEEIAASDCKWRVIPYTNTPHHQRLCFSGIFQGSIRVNLRAAEYLKGACDSNLRHNSQLILYQRSLLTLDTTTTICYRP